MTFLPSRPQGEVNLSCCDYQANLMHRRRNTFLLVPVVTFPFSSNGSDWKLLHNSSTVNVLHGAKGHLFLLEKSYLVVKALLKCDFLCEVTSACHLGISVIVTPSGGVGVSLHVGFMSYLSFVFLLPLLYSSPHLCLLN